jgi:hypothetical protein
MNEQKSNGEAAVEYIKIAALKIGNSICEQPDWLQGVGGVVGRRRAMV